MEVETSPAGQGRGRIVDLLNDPALDARQLQVEAGTSLYEPDAPARDLFLIQSGQVRLFLPGAEGGTRLLEILGAGDWFGVPALAGSPAYGTRATAVGPASIWQVPVDRLMAHLPAVPAVAAELIRQLAGKVQAAHQDAATLVFEDTNTRLVKALVQFSRSAAASPAEEGGESVVLRITHQQLAQAVGAARETVSLALTQLRNQNLLRTGRNRLWFNPAALEDFARRMPPTKRQAGGGAGAANQAPAPDPEPQENAGG